MNYVIAKITDETVTKGEKYPILSMHDGMVNLDVHGVMVCINTEDEDFTICLHACEDCEYCNGDKPVFWQDDRNCAFVDNEGNMLVTVAGASIMYKVEYCPACGRKFLSAKKD